MKLPYLIILAVIFIGLSGCGTDPASENMQIEALLTENAELRERIMQSDQYLGDFSNQYNQILGSLDSIGNIKDSFALLAAQGGSYESDSINLLNEQLKTGRQAIQRLERELAQSGQSDGTVSFLRQQLARAETTIKNLEQDNQRLIEANRNMSEELDLTKSNLVRTRREKEQTAEDRDKLELETERQRKALFAKQQAYDEEVRKNRNKLTAADVKIQTAKNNLELLDTYVRTKNNGSFNIKNKDIDICKEIALKTSRLLEDARRDRHPEAQELLDILYESPKYEEVRPNGM
ncbi:MAG: hypothetical protein WBA17_15145 [Saprospiraceae bacterium]